MTDYSEFAITKVAGKGLKDEADILVDEGLSETEALRSAATTMDGAGDNPKGTVESVQTCTELGGKTVRGLTGDDNPNERTDSFAATEEERLEMADKGEDAAAKWLKQHDPDYKETK